MLNLPRWKDVTYQVGAAEHIRFQVKRLNAAEAFPFKLAMAQSWAAMGEVKQPKKDQAPTPEERKEQNLQMARFYESLPMEQLRKAFREWIRNVEGVSIDGEPATTGEQLFEVADESLVLFVLGEIRLFGSLTVAEGKGSPSPSTSASPAVEPGTSPAGPARPGDGMDPGTAQETQGADVVSFSRGA